MTGTLHADTIEKANGDPVDLTGQSAAKAWILYDQVAVNDDNSFSISSVTDNSAGNFTINYSNSFSARSPCNITTNRRTFSDFWTADAITTSSARFQTDSDSSFATDRNENAISSHGDLA